MPDNRPAGSAGAAIYSRLILAIYDFWVLGVSNRSAWRCSTTEIQLPFFRKHLGQSHLDIGVGTGYYLAHANIPSSTQLTLLDLNQNSLDAAARRLGRPTTRTLLHDATQPLPMDDRYDSISLFYLLHCMPGPVEKKTELFANLKGHLKPKGVLYGSTILGKGVKHNAFGAFLMSLYNWKGLFDNHGDSEDAFAKALHENFEKVELSVEGVVLLFLASSPRQEENGGSRRNRSN